MHESGLIADLLEKIRELAAENSAVKVTAVEVSIGALAGISKEHFREHFVIETQGTIADGAELRIKTMDDPLAPDSHSVLLQSVELEK